MGDLGDVLELLTDSEGRWETLQATGREWHHTARQNEIAERRLAAMRAGQPPGASVKWTGYVPVGDPPPVPDEIENHWRLSMQGRARTRLERSVGGQTSIVVHDGPTWWSWSQHTGGMTNNGAENHRHGVGPAAALIETLPLLSALQFEFLGKDMHLGREVLRVRGLPRARSEYAPDPVEAFGPDADDYVMSVDAELGVLLRSEARLREQPFLVIEMLEVDFDVDLSDDTFALHLPDGETFEDVSRRPRPHVPLRSRLLRRASQRHASLIRRP